MDAFFEDISANNVPTPPTQTIGPQPAQTTGPNNEFEELLSRSTQKLYPGYDMTTSEFTLEISHIKMACVAPRSHGGDAGSSPPRRPTRPVPAQCQSSMLRIKTGNRSLRKAFRENNEQPLKIGFDYEDLDHANVQATRARERVAEEAQAQAYLAALKADAAAQRANVAQQNSEANNAALDLARENNNESSGEEEEDEQRTGGDDDYSDDDDE
ncbi:hypothetical protein Tco_1166100 [Tanacetum coccineum]